MQAEHAGEGGLERGQHGVVGREEGDRLRVDALLGVGRLHQPRHDHFGRVVADGQVVGEVLGDLVALVLVLHAAQLLVAGEFELGALGRFRAGEAGDLGRRLVEQALRSRSRPWLGGLQHLEAPAPRPASARRGSRDRLRG